MTAGEVMGMYQKRVVLREQAVQSSCFVRRRQKKKIEGISNCAENFNNSDLGAHANGWARR
jgi:hypothetical protein